MVGFFLLSLLPLLGLTVAGQEATEMAHLQELSLPLLPHTTSKPSIGVTVSEVDLPVVSSSISAAEEWLKTHVLAHFPSTNITTIVVGNGVLCNRAQELLWGLLLPSVKNLHYSLVRWGLVKEIEVSAAFSSDCLYHPSFYSSFRDDIAQDTLKPLPSFLQETSSAYTIDHSSYSSHLSKRANLVSSAHREALERLGLSRLRDIRVVKKLASLGSPSFVEEPKTLGFRVPSYLAKSPRLPSVKLVPTPPEASFSFAPDAAPSVASASPPYVFAVCEEIGPNGSCYYPDNVVAHASYAFNSYWQKTKQSGGSCNFYGTAVMINSDPSFLQCHFELS